MLKTNLVEEREAHVGILFLLNLLLNSGSGTTSSGGSTTSRSRSSNSTTSGHGSKLFTASSNHLRDVLAFELSKELGDSGGIRFNTNCIN
jgi:hypothetical protein